MFFYIKKFFVIKKDLSGSGLDPDSATAWFLIRIQLNLLIRMRNTQRMFIFRYVAFVQTRQAVKAYICFTD
jgi:hypothetical protein